MLKRLARELTFLILCLAIPLVVFPVLITLSVALFQSTTEGLESASGFLEELAAGLQAGLSWSWWTLLGPYALFIGWRSLRWIWATFREKTRTRRVERAH